MKIDVIHMYTAIVALTSATSSRCPYDLVTTVFSCFQPLTPSKSPGNLGGDAGQFETQCESQSFTKVVECVEEVFKKCMHSRRKHILKDIANPKDMRKTFDTLCRNINVYKGYNTCVTETESERLTCAQSVTAHTMTRHPGDSVQEKLRRACRFMTHVSKCSEKPIRRLCGPVPADFVQSFISVLTPPYCRSYQQVFSSTHFITSSVFVYIVFFCYFIVM